jgi:hypothetical protein
MLRPGAAPLRLWRVEPMPRVLSDGEIASWSARLGLDIAEGLSRLDGFARQTGTPIPGRNTAPIDWKPDPRAFPLPTETTTVDDSNHQPTKQRREAELSSVMLETSDDPARQPFVIVGAPAHELHFLMGAFPGWVLRALPPRGEPMATPPSLPAGLAIEPVSAVAWRVSTAPDAPLPPGRYEFAYAGHHVRAGARLSVAALILLVIFGAIALARRRAPAP